jgi:hypothetical protein
MSANKKRPPSSKLLEELDPKPKIQQMELVSKLMSDEGDDPDDDKKKIFKCLRPGCGKVAKQLKGYGFSNPFAHLRKCYGLVEEIHNAYHSVIAMESEDECSKPSSIKHHFSIIAGTPRERAMHGWIALVVMKGVPISSVEDKVFRSVVKFSDAISIKALVRTIFQLVVFVEQKKELARTPCGALMHDAWTQAGIHYVALFGCYIDEKKKHNPERRCTLLAVSTMPSEDDNSASETVRFHAKVHSKYFSSTVIPLVLEGGFAMSHLPTPK